MFQATLETEVASRLVSLTLPDTEGAALAIATSRVSSTERRNMAVVGLKPALATRPAVPERTSLKNPRGCNPQPTWKRHSLLRNSRVSY